MTWQRNFANVSERIPNNQITLELGLKEIRIVTLLESHSRKELIGIIALQIQNLLEFLGMQNKMSAGAIFDTAEMIIDRHNFFSLKGLQHCFNMVKNSEPPYDKPLYNNISGRHIIEWLNTYDGIVDDFIFAHANDKVYQDTFRAFERTKDDNVQSGLFGVAYAFSRLKEQCKKNGIANFKKK